MSDERSNADSGQLEERLVAYLDGELGAEDSRRVEELLATDAEVRETLQRLDRTWQALDELDRPELGDVFTRTTLEMVTLREADLDRSRRLQAPRIRRRRRWMVGLGLLSAFVAGFLAVRLFWPDPNAELVRDLEVIEQFDQYREAGDLDFLRQLREAGLFVQGPGDGEAAEAPAGVLPVDSSAGENRRRIEAMDDDQKRRLLDSQERFAQLDPDQQQRLRVLHEELAASPEADELSGVMRRYHGWATALPVYERAELAELPPEERVARVKRLLEQQKEASADPESPELATLKPQDRPAIGRWIDQYLDRNKGQFGEMPRGFSRPKPEDARRFGRHAMAWWFSHHRESIEPHLESLRAGLSEDTRQRLEALPADKQCGVLEKWFAQWNRREFAEDRGLPDAFKVNDEELGLFIVHYLTAEDRDYLEQVPDEEMERELRMMYFREKFEDAFRFGPKQGRSGFGRGGRGEQPHKTGSSRGTRPSTGPWGKKPPKPPEDGPPPGDPHPP